MPPKINLQAPHTSTPEPHQLRSINNFETGVLNNKGGYLPQWEVAQVGRLGKWRLDSSIWELQMAAWQSQRRAIRNHARNLWDQHITALSYLRVVWSWASHLISLSLIPFNSTAYPVRLLGRLKDRMCVIFSICPPVKASCKICWKSLFFAALLRSNELIKWDNLKCTTWWSDVCIRCGMITTIRLSNAAITSQSDCVCAHVRVWCETPKF